MTGVLVGGKKRKDVLANRLEELQRFAEEKPATVGSVPAFQGKYRRASGWEVHPPTIDGKINGEKARHTFVDGLGELAKRGYQRYPLPAEMFELINNTLHERTNAQDLLDSIDNSHGEWFDLAVWPHKDKLLCFEYPRKMHWNGTTYQFHPENPTCQFPLNGIPLETRVPLVEVYQKSPDLGQYLWGVTFESLHDNFKYRTTTLFLPPEGITWPVSYEDGSRSITAFGYTTRATRGVSGGEKP